MWEYEHSVETDAGAGAIWGLWREVEEWPRWNADIEEIRLEREFVEGGWIVMTPRGGEPVRLRLLDVRPYESFTDQAELGETLVRTEHLIEATEDGRRRVTYRMRVEGPGAEQLGPAISADFPETIAALVALAES
jgi:hypothetical protein